MKELRGIVTMQGLPGLGPWRILDECPSFAHNTAHAARGYYASRGIPCICPGALVRLEQHRTKEREHQRAVRAGLVVTPMPAWWSGPWRILDECPADGHHAVNRAIGRGGAKRCICPRALELKRVYAKKRQARDSKAKEAQKLNPTPTIPTVKAANLPDIRQRPDMSVARCQKPWNIPVFDSAFQVGMRQGFRAEWARERAKAVCANCPIRSECLAWTLKQEGRYPGSFGGVYGGMDAAERKKEVMAHARDREQ